MSSTASRIAVAGALFAGALAARAPLLSWGATGAERRRPLPGDGLVPGERGISTMAVSIAAPPAGVWPWLEQMGCDRAGWYSWDRLDNRGRPSADTINPEWRHVAEGDRLNAIPGGAAWFDVAHVEPHRSLVLRASLDHRGHPFDPAGPHPRFYSDARWEFFLDPQDDGRTRLLVRSGGVGRPRALTEILNYVFWHPAHVVMQVRQLHEIRRRAERLAGQFGAGEPRHAVGAGVA
jgi:hypothetical protein